MNKAKGFYRILDDFVGSNIWQGLSDKRVIGVEIPTTKEMYYVSVDLWDRDAVKFDIDVVKGNEGLLTLREAYGKKTQTVDKIIRGDFMSVNFEYSSKAIPNAFLDGFDEDYTYEGFERVGFPFIFQKSKGHASRPLDKRLRSDLAIVFEALMSRDFGKIKKIKFHKKTKIKTFYKKDDMWQLEDRVHQLKYKKAKYSDLEIYPLLKQSHEINELWYMTSIYDYRKVDDKETLVRDKGPAYKASGYLLDPDGDVLIEEDFVGESQEIPAMKTLIRKVLRTLEVRPTTIVTNLRSLYYAFKDFMGALDIEFIYEPLDETIKDFSEYIFDDEIKGEENSLENMLIDITLAYFLKIKGIKPKELPKLSEKEEKDLLEEFYEVLDEIIEPFETFLEERKENLDVSSEEAIDEKIKDLFIKAMEDKDNL